MNKELDGNPFSQQPDRHALVESLLGPRQTVIGELTRALIGATLLLSASVAAVVGLHHAGTVSLDCLDDRSFRLPMAVELPAAFLYAVGPLIGIFSLWLYHCVRKIEGAVRVTNSRDGVTPDTTPIDEPLLATALASNVTALLLITVNWLAIGLQFYCSVQWFFVSEWVSCSVMTVWSGMTSWYTLRLIGLRSWLKPGSEQLGESIRQGNFERVNSEVIPPDTCS